MPYFLANRDTASKELMDDPGCSQSDLFNTYRQFSTINSMISGWRKIYKSRIKPLFSDPTSNYSLLDIGFGGGDIPRKIAKWATRDGLTLNITAIETDSRALEFVKTRPKPQNVTFRQASSTDLVAEGKQFDIVISNHLIHHLGGSEMQQLLKESKKLAGQAVLFNDIERSDVGYGLFNIFSRPVFRSSFITHDGLTSIRRSFTRAELRRQTPDEWRVERLFPYRLLLSWAP